MGFFAFIVGYAQRVDLSVAIVAMVNATYLREHENKDKGNSTKNTDVCPAVSKEQSHAVSYANSDDFA